MQEKEDYTGVYDQLLEEQAKLERAYANEKEKTLWDFLQHEYPEYAFTFKQPLGDLIVDFYSTPLRLAINIKDETHEHCDAYFCEVKDLLFLEEKNILLQTIAGNELEAMKNNLADIINAMDK